jgi:solute carrier family 25 carnitine/acylcarnitine transporter 20/29
LLTHPQWFLVETGNSIVYLISTLLEPPSDVIQTAVSDLSLSTFVASTFAAGLDKFVKRASSKTYLAPQNKAFEELGLVMSYLLLPDAKPDLKKLIRYHMVDEVRYLNDIPLGNGSLKTVAGEDLYWNRTWRNASNPVNITDAITVYGTQYQVGQSSSLLPANGDETRGTLVAGNMLTSTGTLHSIDRVLLPVNIDITIGKLVAGAKISTMADLLIRAKMEWVLTGTPPPGEGHNLGFKDDASTMGKTHDLLPAYTLLCPTDHAFSKINLTYFRNNEAALMNLLKLHIIPSDRISPVESTSPPQSGKPLALNEGIIYPTLHSADSAYGDLVVRNIIDDEWIVGVKDARGQSQDHNAGRIVSWGRATPRWLRSSDTAFTAPAQSGMEGNLVNSTWNGIMTLGGGVVVIDNVLLPYEPSWFFRWGWLVAILGFVALLTLGFIALGVWFWKFRRMSEEPKYEALEGEEDE